MHISNKDNCSDDIYCDRVELNFYVCRYLYSNINKCNIQFHDGDNNNDHINRLIYIRMMDTMDGRLYSRSCGSNIWE